MEGERLHVFITGRVQRAGFRAFVLQEAAALALTGFARNLPDCQTVEVIAEGPKESLEHLLAELTRGPVRSRVDNVDATWADSNGEFQTFDLRQ